MNGKMDDEFIKNLYYSDKWYFMDCKNDFETLAILKDYALNVLEKCEIRIETSINGHKKQFTLQVPSGDMKYGSFWVRDAAMMAESGLIAVNELKDWLDFIVLVGQNGSDAVELEHGLIIPPWAVADHINFDGKPVSFPGTYESGDDQGDGKFGYFPPHDDQYYFIEIAYSYYANGGDLGFLNEKHNGISIIERLEKAFESYNIDEQTQLCMSSINRYTVDWGFCDTVIKSGYLLFPSLLRYRAALRLKEMNVALKDSSKSVQYDDTAQHLKKNIISIFYDNSGWFLSATGVCRQKDIWGTAFALWLDILEDPHKKMSAAALLKAYEDGIAVDNGYVRHILVGEEASRYSAWESAASEYNTYQNGGYWAAPTGWYAYALSLVNNDAAIDMMDKFIEHTKRFKQEGAPFEWRSADDREYSGLLYGASAALPYAGFKRLLCCD